MTGPGGEAPATTVRLDGAAGEGGGQILRSALALSVVTGRPLEIARIRARRSKPGLRPQHLACVRAAAAISRAAVDGARVGSEELRFHPGPARPGTYGFAIETAGATALVLQTVLLPLALADRGPSSGPGGPASAAPSTVDVEGGTHVPLAPTADYVARVFLPALERMSGASRLSLARAGFLPRGGGRLVLEVRPGARLVPLDLARRGPLVAIEGLSIAGLLAPSIAERQARQAERRLRKALADAGVRVPLEVAASVPPAAGPGTAILLVARFASGARHGASALGAPGKPAERVADEAAQALLESIGDPGDEGGASVDDHLADQLLLPCALASGTSRFAVARRTSHFDTNADVVRAFVPVEIREEAGAVEVRPAATSPPRSPPSAPS